MGTNELMMTGKPNMGTETQDTGKQSLTNMFRTANIHSYLHCQNKQN